MKGIFAGVLCALLLVFHVVNAEARKRSLLVFTSVHREQALDVWALTEYLVSSRGYEALVLAPEPLANNFLQAAGSESEAPSRKECHPSCSLKLMAYPSVAFEEYQTNSRGSIQELTAMLDFHLANCAGLLTNHTLLDAVSKHHYTAFLGIANDPCSTFLADKLAIRRRAAYDDGSASSLMWGVLLGQGLPTSHVAMYGTGLGSGSMGLMQRVRNVVQYHRLRLWHGRVYEPRLVAFRRRYHVGPLPTPLLPGSNGRGRGGGGGGGSRGIADRSGEGRDVPACHLRGQVIITGADWGLLEPQPLPPAVKLVGPIRAVTMTSLPPPPSVEADAAPVAATNTACDVGGYPLLHPPELAEHVGGAESGVAVICFPPDYRLPLRALLALAEAVIDLKQRIVWQVAEKDIARVRQLYLPLRHARHVLLLPHVPLPELMAQRQVVSLISAGSVQAIYAGLAAGKPVMVVALNAAQEDLVARMVALGAGQRLSRRELEGGAASYLVSVAIERMSNVYSFTQSMQLLATQLRATHGSSSSVELAATWVDYTAALDEQGRHFLTPRSMLAGSAASGVYGGEPAAGGGGGCMGALEASNLAPYSVLVASGLATVSLVFFVVHICTRVPTVPGACGKLARAVVKMKDD